MTPPPPIVVAYHGLGTVPYRLDVNGLMVPVDSFRRQVRRLRRRGYTFVHQAELARRMAVGDAEGLCSLTFDDGPLDNATVLPGLLEELDVPATLFVCPGLLGQPWPFVDPEAGLRLCTAAELREVAANPRVEIGSHTREHTELDAFGADAALEEMVASKRDLEELLDVEVVSFAYPSCGYSAGCVESVPRAGYTSAVTCGSRGGRYGLYAMARASPAPPDGRLVFELKTRGHFFPAREFPPVRLLRRLARPLRWR